MAGYDAGLFNVHLRGCLLEGFPTYGRRRQRPDASPAHSRTAHVSFSWNKVPIFHILSCRHPDAPSPHLLLNDLHLNSLPEYLTWECLLSEDVMLTLLENSLLLCVRWSKVVTTLSHPPARRERPGGRGGGRPPRQGRPAPPHGVQTAHEGLCGPGGL